MKKHTTYTDICRIMKLHGDGMSTEEISNEVFIDAGAVQAVIDVKAPKKKVSKKKPKLVEA